MAKSLTFSVLNLMLLITIISSYNIVNSSRILGLFTTPFRSHLQTHMAIVNGLVQRGHNVTVVTTFPVKNVNNTFRHIHLEMPELRKEFLHLIKKSSETLVPYIVMLEIYQFLQGYSAACLQEPVMKNLMQNKEEHFDLVLVGYLSNEVQFGVAAHFNAPVAIVWVNKLLMNIGNYVGNPFPISYVPFLFSGNSQPMDFYRRLQNYIYFFFDSFKDFYFYYNAKSLYRVTFPPEFYPSYDTMIRNISLILCNYYFAENYIIPEVPSIKEIGGIQIKEKPDTLPDNIKNIFDNASRHGVIYFSLGTMAKTSDLDPKIIKIIYKVFSALPQSIIWKWETNHTYPGNSSNIFFLNWLPQDDILAQDNLRLFVTHGGVGSVAEAKYHGVPIVAIPLFGDQFANVELAVRSGWGKMLGFNDINENCFRTVITDVLGNSSYKENVQRISKIYRDRPMSAMETAMYWIEYVIRHRGAPHMQSPAVHMNFLSYYSLDVLGVIFVILFVIYKLFKYILKFLWKLLHHVRGKREKTD